MHKIYVDRLIVCKHSPSGWSWHILAPAAESLCFPKHQQNDRAFIQPVLVHTDVRDQAITGRASGHSA